MLFLYSFSFWLFLVRQNTLLKFIFSRDDPLTYQTCFLQVVTSSFSIVFPLLNRRSLVLDNRTFFYFEYWSAVSCAVSWWCFWWCFSFCCPFIITLLWSLGMKCALQQTIRTLSAYSSKTLMGNCNKIELEGGCLFVFFLNVWSYTPVKLEFLLCL